MKRQRDETRLASEIKDLQNIIEDQTERCERLVEYYTNSDMGEDIVEIFHSIGMKENVFVAITFTNDIQHRKSPRFYPYQSTDGAWEVKIANEIVYSEQDYREVYEKHESLSNKKIRALYIAIPKGESRIINFPSTSLEDLYHFKNALDIDALATRYIEELTEIDHLTSPASDAEYE